MSTGREIIRALREFNDDLRSGEINWTRITKLVRLDDGRIKQIVRMPDGTIATTYLEAPDEQ